MILIFKLLSKDFCGLKINPKRSIKVEEQADY